jgi:hypothetical protein
MFSGAGAAVANFEVNIIAKEGFVRRRNLKNKASLHKLA